MRRPNLISSVIVPLRENKNSLIGPEPARSNARVCTAVHRTFDQVVQGEALPPHTVTSNIISSDHQVRSIQNQRVLKDISIAANIVIF